MSGGKRGLQGKPVKAAAGASHALADVEGQDRSAWVVPVKRIRTDPNQPRRVFDEEALAGLAQDIAKRGVRQPLTVRKNGDEYLIIAGERRYRAALQADLENIPVRLIEPENVFEEQLVENLQREDLNPVDEANAIYAFKTHHDLTVRETAERLGLSKSAIDRKMKIIEMSDAVKKALQTGEITFSEAEKLGALPSTKPPKRGRPVSTFLVKEKRGGAFDATIRFRPGKTDKAELVKQLKGLIEKLNEMVEVP